MNDIRYLKIEMRPLLFGNGYMELRVETMVNGQITSSVIPFAEDDFQHRFSQMMEAAEECITRLVKSHRRAQQGGARDE